MKDRAWWQWLWDVIDSIIHDRDDEVAGSVRFWFYFVASICLVLLAGLMSGLTLGLMSLDVLELEVLRRSGTRHERRFSAAILPLLKHQHLLLVTLLTCNAAAAEALPICLDRLVHPAVALVLSVTAVLFFGEIIPQAICSRYGLAVGYYTAPFVKLLIKLCYVIAKPISMILDRILGRERQALMRRAQLKTLMSLYHEGGNLSTGEVNVISGALDLANKQARCGMTPIEAVFMLPADAVLDFDQLRKIVDSGYSRIPVYRPGRPHDIIGLLIVKELAVIDPNKRIPVSDLTMRSIPRMWVDTPLSDLLDLFQMGRSHMALLVERGGGGGIGVGVGVGRSTTVQAALRETLHGGEGAGGGGGSTRRVATMPVIPTTTEQQSQPPTASSSSSPTTDAIASELSLLHAAPIVGIITLEDCIEELIGEEIVDETDQFVDNLHTTSVSATNSLMHLPPRLRDLVAGGVFTVRKGKLARNTKSSTTTATSMVYEGNFNPSSIEAAGVAATGGDYRLLLASPPASALHPSSLLPTLTPHQPPSSHAHSHSNHVHPPVMEHMPSFVTFNHDEIVRELSRPGTPGMATGGSGHNYPRSVSLTIAAHANANKREGDLHTSLLGDEDRTEGGGDV